MPSLRSCFRHQRSRVSCGVVLRFIAAATLLSLPSCTSAPWPREFQPAASGENLSVSRSQGAIVMREAPRALLAAITEGRMGADEQAALRREVRAPAGSSNSTDAQILGFSRFETTDTLNADDALESFARTRGATHVLWSAELVGTRTSTRSRRVGVYRDSTWTDPADPNSDWRMRDLEGSTAGGVNVPETTEQRITEWIIVYVRAA